VVEVKNQCPCAIRSVRLDGRGFATIVVVDPAAFRADDGGVYLVNGGKRLPSMATVSFQYAWDHFFQMTPRSLEVFCSPPPRCVFPGPLGVLFLVGSL
jgi:hypothetical protein